MQLHDTVELNSVECMTLKSLTLWCATVQDTSESRRPKKSMVCTVHDTAGLVVFSQKPPCGMHDTTISQTVRREVKMDLKLEST